jgi:hypothetical protein
VDVPEYATLEQTSRRHHDNLRLTSLIARLDHDGVCTEFKRSVMQADVISNDDIDEVGTIDSCAKDVGRARENVCSVPVLGEFLDLLLGSGTRLACTPMGKGRT